MTTFWEIAARYVGLMFLLSFVYLYYHREESPSLDRNFRNPFTEIPERLPVQSVQSDTQN